MRVRPKPGRQKGWLVEGREYVVLELHTPPAPNLNLRSRILFDPHVRRYLAETIAMFRIEADFTPPAGVGASEALLPASDFDLLDGRLPSCWRAELSPWGEVELAPASWQAFRWPSGSPEWSYGFWEAFYGDVEGADSAEAEAAARALYAKEKAAMLAEDAQGC